MATNKIKPTAPPDGGSEEGIKFPLIAKQSPDPTELAKFDGINVDSQKMFDTSE